MTNPTPQLQQQLNEFIQRVDNVYEIEYGDFKRKVGLYLNRLEQEFKGQGKSVAAFDEIRKQVVYQPTPDIEMTRQNVLLWAKQLKV